VGLLPSLLVAQGAAAFDPWHESARYEIEYRVELGGLPPGAARAWLPLPAQSPGQRLLELHLTAPPGARETRDALGNRMLYAEFRRGRTWIVRAVVERDSLTPFTPAGQEPGRDPSRFLAPQRRIPLDGVIRRIATEQLRELPPALPVRSRIRAFYDYVVSHMSYSKRGKGWGHGDAIWACTRRYGNCTDFHSLFLGLARSQGIPARFVIGFPLPAERQEGPVPGYHCWAEAYDPALGWLPLDASEARKTGRPDAYFARLPSDRVAFSVGRDLVLSPPQDGAPLNYFIYPYVEVEGRAVPTPPWSFRFRRLLGGSRPAVAAGAPEAAEPAGG